jgi:hypothetical protein
VYLDSVSSVVPIALLIIVVIILCSVRNSIYITFMTIFFMVEADVKLLELVHSNECSRLFLHPLPS